MAELLIRNAKIATPTRSGLHRGLAMRDVERREGVDVLFRDGIVAEAGVDLVGSTSIVIDARGRVLVPGLVDCHTHACWAGSRIDEWERKLAGADYLELLRGGGGIMATVRAVREASEGELAATLLAELNRMLACGTTTAEVKSGYGLGTEHELKMLRAIVRAGDSWAGRVVPTACIGHAIDGLDSAFVDRTIAETLPAVTEAFGPIAIDAYCEEGAWSLDDCVRLFGAAADAGHPCRVHADQFNELGMVDHAVGHGFVSVDHLEASSGDAIRRLGATDTAGVVLPVCGVHLDGRFADGRSLVDAGGGLAIATNNNPGSAPCHSVPMAMALAVRSVGLSPDEALVAATSNSAAVLGLDRVGHLSPGAAGDAVLLDAEDDRVLSYGLGPPPIAAVVCSGEVAWSAPRSDSDVALS